MSHSSSQNRRRAARLHHELPVAYRAEGSFLTDAATDISQGGLFINTREPLPVGTELKLIVQLPGAASPLEIAGRVTRVVQIDAPHDGAPGMAVEFVDLQAETRAQLDAFVERLRRELDPG